MINPGIPINKGYPTYAAVNPKTATVYLSYQSSNFILPVNTTSRAFEDKIEVRSPGNIVVNSVTNIIYVPTLDGIYVFDGITNQFIRLLSEGEIRPKGAVEVNPITNTIFTTSFDSNVLTMIDGKSGFVKDKIEVGKDPRGIAVDPISNRTYVANSGSNSISVIDGQSGKLRDTIEIGSGSAVAGKGPEFIIANPARNEPYIQYFEIIGAEGQAIFLVNLLIIDRVKKRVVSKRKLFNSLARPPVDGMAFAFNSSNSALYVSKPSRNIV